MKPTFSAIKHILATIDWTGHVELPDLDLSWLAHQLSAKLSDRNDMCASCGAAREIIVLTRLGPICEDCLDEATEIAEQMREEME